MCTNAYRVSSVLWDTFVAACRAHNKPAAQALWESTQTYIAEHGGGWTGRQDTQWCPLSVSAIDHNGDNWTLERIEVDKTSLIVFLFKNKGLAELDNLSDPDSLAQKCMESP